MAPTPRPPLTKVKKKPKRGEVLRGCLIFQLPSCFFCCWSTAATSYFLAQKTILSKADPRCMIRQRRLPPQSELASPSVPGPSPAPYLGTPVSVDQLFNAYERNEVLADQIYKGALILVTGRVGSINKSIGDGVYLTLPSKQNQLEGIHAEIADEDRWRAANLRKGQQVTPSCKGGGKLLSDVMLSDCTFHYSLSSPSSNEAMSLRCAA